MTHAGGVVPRQSSGVWLGQLLCALLLVSVVGCSQAASPQGIAKTDGSSPAASDTPGATLTLLARAEPPNLAGTPLVTESINYYDERRFFNAGLALYDAQLQPQPYLAEQLPQLNTDDWKLFSDGTMETTYRLRQGLTWHDGVPLTGSDFVFAWQVYQSPDVATARLAPYTLMADVAAPDDRTVVIRWSGTFPTAGALQGITGSSQNPFTPLPRHILEPAFSASPSTLTTLPYWSVEYIGAGPYRLARWEPGSFLEATSFEGHALGKPKIDRIHVDWVGDSNAALTRLLSGNAAMPINNAVQVDQGFVLKEQWSASKAGTVAFLPDNGRYERFQFRPEYVRPQALLDVRVRQALASTVDKDAANEALFHGVATITDTWIFPTAPYYAQIQREVPTYPDDPQRAAQLMAAAGFAKNAAGVYAGPDGPLSLETKNVSSQQNNSERSIISDGWRRFGFDVEEAAATPDEARDSQVLATFRSIWATGGGYGEQTFDALLSRQTPTADNRWIGNNRGGWANADYDRLITDLATTVPPDERVKLIVQAAKLINEEVPVISLYYSAQVLAYTSALNIAGSNERAPSSVVSWNIYNWEYRP